MSLPVRVAVFTFLIALAIQARVLSSGNLTPWGPLAIGLAVGAGFAIWERRGRRAGHVPPEV